MPENTKSAGVVTASDADGDAVTLALTGGADASLVSFEAATGALMLRPCAVNFESPIDANADNTLELTFSASDGKATTTQALRVAITNVVEPTIGSGLVVLFGGATDDVGSFSSGGDIDCDGFPETLVTSGVQLDYDVHVLFGNDLRTKSNTTVTLPGTLGGGAGVRIRGAEKYDPDYRSASFAGDVDGDGRGDIVIASPANGRVYVVFGDALMDARAGSGAIDLDVLGDDGVRIDGVNAIVSAVGDVDGDGLHDIAFGEQFSAHYVVFGSALKSERTKDRLLTASQLAGSGDGVELTTGSRHIDFDRTAVLSPAGDVDGDGLADLAIGIPASNVNGGWSGEAFIVLGAALKAVANAPGTIDLTTIEDHGRGMRVAGGAFNELAASSVAGVGGLDSDDLGEILVGAPNFDVPGKANVGQVALIRGARLKASMQAQAQIDWSSLSSDGSTLLILGPSDSSRIGISVASAGDVDGDNLPDVVIGAPNESSGVPAGGGGAYILFGSGIRALSTLDLSAAPFSSIAVKVVAQRGGSFSGHLPDMLLMGGSLAPLGDVDGDGLDEIAVGQIPEESTDYRSAIFIISGARIAQAKAGGAQIRLNDMLQ